MTQKDFDLQRNKAISKLRILLKELEQITYIEKTPIQFEMSNINLAVEEIERTINNFKRFIKVFPIREKRIKKLKIIQENWYNHLDKEGKEIWEDYKKRPFTMDEVSFAHSWKE